MQANGALEVMRSLLKQQEASKSASLDNIGASCLSSIQHHFWGLLLIILRAAPTGGQRR